ncbi:hypothetical protein ACIQZG_15340 [Lysinibacillus sp. NPDC096418]|uniref:hypothetical protein n=1 Tax=Lysinibacillus sp. NPDC096418 TaxID=3364138 RepID=UPI0038032EE5
MEESKFAQLNQEQIEKINDLEQKIGVTLLAYDHQVIQRNNESSTRTTDLYEDV